VNFNHAFVSYLAFCFAHFIVQSKGQTVSLREGLPLFRPFAHLLDAPVRAKFAISNFEVESAKDLTKNKVANWLNFRVIQSGSECFSGSVVGCGWVVQRGGADLPTLFTTRLSNWRKQSGAKTRGAIGETRDLFGCAASSLRLFGAHNYCTTTTGTRSRTRTYIIIHIHRYLYWIFFPKFGF